MKPPQPSSKAVNRINPQLAKSLEDAKKGLLQVKMIDGKVKCPGCSLETKIDPPAGNVRWVSMPAVCSKCRVEFRIFNPSEA